MQIYICIPLLEIAINPSLVAGRCPATATEPQSTTAASTKQVDMDQHEEVTADTLYQSRLKSRRTFFTASVSQ
jgi:hypothetical protein